MVSIPTSIIAGYLGSGKTTLLNEILNADHPERLAILVNDFGDINIDQRLIESQDEMLLGLTNGCICCSIGGAFFDALDRVIKLQPRIDAIIIEASGIAEPKNIANIARAEKELEFDGTFVLIDSTQVAEQATHSLIKDSIINQISQANLLVLSKTDIASRQHIKRALHLIEEYAPNTPVIDKQKQHFDFSIINSVKINQDGIQETQRKSHNHQHGLYCRFLLYRSHFQSKQELTAFLQQIPDGLLRLKGFIQIQSKGYLIQMVGRFLEIKQFNCPSDEYLVAIGLQNQADQLKRYFTQQFLIV